jgi:hypothetical protein
MAYSSPTGSQIIRTGENQPKVRVGSDTAITQNLAKPHTSGQSNRTMRLSFQTRNGGGDLRPKTAQ